MLKAIPPLPLKFKRRSVSAVRNFPNGCRVRASAASSKPIIAGTPPSLLDAKTTEDLSASNNRKASAQESRASPLPPPEENGIKIASDENEGLGQNNGELVAFDESRGSTLPEKMEIEKGSEENEGVDENSGKLVASEPPNLEEAEESNGSMMPLEKETSAKGDEGMGQTNGKLEASELPNGAETDGGEEVVRENGGVDEQFAEPEASELPAESPCLLEFGSRKYVPPKRRRVSVVRHFPAGCGRNAPRIGMEKFAMAVSSESKTTGKKLAVGVGSTKEEDDGEVRRSDVGNEVVVENSTAKNEEDLGKKNGKPIRERKGRDSFGETDGNKLAAGVRPAEDEVMRHDVTSHAVVKSSPEKDEDDVGKKNSEPTRERKKVHDSSGERRFKSLKKRNSEGQTSAIKQVSKNLQGQASRDVRPQSGIKAGKPVDNVSIKCPKDGNTLKRKLSEEGIDGDHVMGVKSRGKSPLEAYRDDSIVQASASSQLVTPKSKAKDKMKMLSRSDRKGKSLVIDKTSQPQNVPLNHDCDSGSNNEGSSARGMVKRTLRLFQKLLQEEEANSKGPRRADLNAASILKESNNWVNYGKPIIGDVPGVEVGDKFHWRVELSIIGLHRPFQWGIDFMKRGDGMILATSIVSSGGYPTNLESSDELIYSGSGGNPDAKKKKEAGDQKLERGNLALKNSIDAKTPVRVIYGGKLQDKSDYGDARAKTVTTFTYDGLYLVEEYWAEAGPRGFSVFKFKLRRLPRNQCTREDSGSDRE